MSYQDRLQRNLILYRVSWFFNSLLFFMPIWYAFETQFTDGATLAIIYAITHLIAVALELPTGALADLLGRKTIVALGYMIHGLAWVVIAQAKDVSWLWAGYIIAQLGNTFISGANIALYYDTLKELKIESKFSSLLSENELVYRVGIILSTALGGYIFLLNKGLPYTMVGVSMIIAGIITFFMIEPRIDSEKFTFSNYLKQTKLGFAQLWKTSYIRDFSLYYVSVGGITWYYLYFLLNAFMTDSGFDPVARGWLSSFNSLLVAILGIVIVKKRLLSKTATYIFFPVVMLIGFLPSPFIPKLGAVISIFLIYFIGIIRFTLLDQYANDEFESKYRATAISALNMTVSLIYFLLTFALNPILTKFGSGWVMFSLGILTIVTTIPTTIVLLKKHKA